jgi:hypothetical protein
MNTISTSYSGTSSHAQKYEGLTRNEVTGNFESKNILQHLKTEQECVNVVKEISLRFRELRIHYIVKNLDI